MKALFNGVRGLDSQTQMNLDLKIEPIAQCFSKLGLVGKVMRLPNLVESKENLGKNRIYLRKKTIFCWRKV
ncbi:hypothetical protein FAZ90_20230 [Vibrio cyclitrophicus]|nr:hypothetical protein BCV43_10165 [Vibrio cyclitrophicus]QCI73355.1 hypothetical protein FAZ90_20230 [Vibrio cyclitrophicus]